MDKEKSKDLTVDQITDAKRLCDVVRGVPNNKRQVFELVMLAYLNGIEAGVAYAENMTPNLLITR